jgi:hypothetical protein
MLNWAAAGMAKKSSVERTATRMRTESPQA